MGLRLVGLLPCAVLPWAPKAPKAATLIRRIRPTTAPYRVPAVALQSAPSTSNTNLQQQQVSTHQQQTDLNNCRCSSNTVTLPIQAPIAAVASIPAAPSILTPAVQPIVTPAVQQQPTTSRQPTPSATTTNPTTSPMLLVPFSAVPAANCGTFVPIQQHPGTGGPPQTQPPPGVTPHNVNGGTVSSQVPTPNNIVNGNGNVNNKVRQILYN